jgi:hypothetical protein
VLQVSLDGPFLIAPSVFSNVYFHPAGVTSVSGWSILDCTFGFLYRLFSSCRCYKCLWIVHSWLHLRFSLTFIFILPVLQVSLDGPFLIAPSVFSTVYFHPAGVTSVSGWSILDCTFGFLYRLFSSCRCYKCLWMVHSWLHLRFSLTFIFILPVLQVSLDRPFLIAPSVFSNVYFHPVGLCLWMVHFWLHLRFSLTFIFILPVLQVSLDGPFLIAPSVFSNVYFHLAGVTSVSGWSILDCTFGFL